MSIAVCSYSGLKNKDFDIYAAYSPELFIRVGMNYKFLGVYIRPTYSRNDKGYPYFTSIERIGGEMGINLNRRIFEFKFLELIANASGGFTLSRVRQNLDGLVFWEKSVGLALIPEIRFFKKASITISPLSFIYYFPQDEVDYVATTVTKMPQFSFLNTSLGIKLYY
jgi:hypothetical protein